MVTLILVIWIVGMFVMNVLVHWHGWFEYEYDSGPRFFCTVFWPVALIGVGFVKVFEVADTFCEYVVAELKKHNQNKGK